MRDRLAHDDTGNPAPPRLTRGDIDLCRLAQPSVSGCPIPLSPAAPDHGSAEAVTLLLDHLGAGKSSA